MEQEEKKKNLGNVFLGVTMLAASAVGLGAAGAAFDQAVDSVKTGHPVRAAFLAVSGTTSSMAALWVGGLFFLRQNKLQANERIRNALRPGK